MNPVHVALVAYWECFVLASVAVAFILGIAYGGATKPEDEEAG